jgi:hypothetical protein
MAKVRVADERRRFWATGITSATGIARELTGRDILDATRLVYLDRGPGPAAATEPDAVGVPPLKGNIFFRSADAKAGSVGGPTRLTRHNTASVGGGNCALAGGL